MGKGGFAVRHRIEHRGGCFAVGVNLVTERVDDIYAAAYWPTKEKVNRNVLRASNVEKYGEKYAGRCLQL